LTLEGVLMAHDELGVSGWHWKVFCMRLQHSWHCLPFRSVNVWSDLGSMFRAQAGILGDG